MRWHFLVVGLVALAVVACSGGKVIEQPDPIPPAGDEKNPVVTETKDPFDRHLNKFEKTYRELVCRSNRDYDPMSNVGIIVEPCDLLTRYVEEKSRSIDPYEQIIMNNGYDSVAAFFAARDHIEKAKRGWWKDLTGRLFDLIEACP